MTKAAKKTNAGATRPSARKRLSVPATAAAGNLKRRRTSKTRMANPQPPKSASKRDQLAALLVRDQGATIAQMQELTGWLPHTVRAALTRLKKLGYAIDSDKVDDMRTYRAVAPE